MSYSSSGGRQNYKAILSKAFDVIVNPAKIQSAMSEVASFGNAYIKSEAPVRTGFLSSMSGCEIVGPYSIVLYSSAPYAEYVNGGTYKMAANPYFDRSARAVWDKLLSIF